MQKILAMTLGVILASGVSVPAFAATVDFSGFYSAHFISGGNQGFTDGDNLMVHQSRRYAQLGRIQLPQ